MHLERNTVEHGKRAVPGAEVGDLKDGASAVR